MGRAARVERTVEQVVALRRVRDAVVDGQEQRRLERVLRQLRREVGVSVPKRRAAALLGVTVPALERWIAAGRLPVVRRPGSSRDEIDSEALIELATEVTRLREAGHTRGVLAQAFERLRAEGKPRPKLRPNERAHDLRESFLRTTPLERLRQAAELSYVATTLAAHGAKRRRG